MAANGAMLDATQEMITLGFCNIVGSFLLSMPISGSFTRSAVNNSSGVRTPFGGLYTGRVSHVRVAMFPVLMRSRVFILSLISIIAKDKNFNEIASASSK
jgi:MFS superfamily sulfate permease-like transporter